VAIQDTRFNHLRPTTMDALVKWIERSGGKIHEALEIRDDGSSSSRGVYATQKIAKGQTLIYLPNDLVLSGESMPAEYDNKVTSPWLRTVAALIRAWQEGEHFRAYLEMLPTEYDSLLDWTDEEVSDYLAGTTLGSMIQLDRTNDALMAGYRTSVRPYLQHLQLLSSSVSNDEEIFGRACRCISTRGFHLQQSLEDSQLESSVYNGPFLLPYIDLINHSTKKKCTTLKRNESDRSFFMEAERDISADEEILHSYGEVLTAAQLLQTFGFVPLEASKLIVSDGPRIMRNALLTPAVLSKASIVQAVHDVIQSGYPDKIKRYMKTHKMEEDEVWEVKCEEGRDLSIIPDDILVEPDCPLSDELVTLCCLLLLPPAAYTEIFMDSPVLLDKAILEDYFLGKLVGKVLFQSIAINSATYTPLHLTVDGVKYSNSSDKELLSLILPEIDDAAQYQRARYGLTIRLEEKACLESLRVDLLELMDFLDDDTRFTHPSRQEEQST
jgi:hypothetical protein